MALGLGALLGLVGYGTYDFTNLSTLRNWPVMVSIVDLLWGPALSAVAATLGISPFGNGGHEASRALPPQVVRRAIVL